jgi:hypothetical protein
MIVGYRGRYLPSSRGYRHLQRISFYCLNLEGIQWEVLDFKRTSYTCPRDIVDDILRPQEDIGLSIGYHSFPPIWRGINAIWLISRGSRKNLT